MKLRFTTGVEAEYAAGPHGIQATDPIAENSFWRPLLGFDSNPIYPRYTAPQKETRLELAQQVALSMKKQTNRKIKRPR